MKYLIGLLVVLFAVAVALKVPVYRAAAWVIAGGLLLLGGAFFFLQKSPPPVVSDKPTQEDINEIVQADALLWQVVKPEQVAIVSSTLTPAEADDERHAMNYAGKVKNLSDRGIDKVALRIRLYDCPGKPPANWVGCLIIDDDTQNIPVQLAGHQTAAVSGLFQFHHFRESTGHFAIRPEINRVHATSAAQ